MLLDNNTINPNYTILVESYWERKIPRRKKSCMYFRKIKVNNKNYHESHGRHPEQIGKKVVLDSSPVMGLDPDHTAYLNSDGSIILRDGNGKVPDSYPFRPLGAPIGHQNGSHQARKTANGLRQMMIDFLMDCSNDPDKLAVIQRAMLTTARNKPEKLIGLAASLVPKENYNTNQDITNPAVIVFEHPRLSNALSN